MQVHRVLVSRQVRVGAALTCGIALLALVCGSRMSDASAQVRAHDVQVITSATNIGDHSRVLQALQQLRVDVARRQRAGALDAAKAARIRKAANRVGLDISGAPMPTSDRSPYPTPPTPPATQHHDNAGGSGGSVGGDASDGG